MSNLQKRSLYLHGPNESGSDSVVPLEIFHDADVLLSCEPGQKMSRQVDSGTADGMGWDRK